MNEDLYKTVELTGSSRVSAEDAIQTAIARAGKTLDHLKWFEVTDTRGYIEENEVAHWQVTMKIGFSVAAH